MQNRPWLALVFGAMFCPLFFIVIGLSSHPAVKAAFTLLAVCIGALSIWMFQVAREGAMHTVRIRAGGSLSFVSQSFSGLWGLLAAAAMLSVGVVYLFAALVPIRSAAIASSGERTSNPVWPLLLGAGTLAYFLHRGVPAVGLELDECGIRTRAGLAALEITWGELRAPELLQRQRGIVLLLVGQEGKHSVLYPMYFGSDPVIVAEVIEFYRTHPGERHLLADPIAALARVVEIEAEPGSTLRRDG